MRRRFGLSLLSLLLVVLVGLALISTASLVAVNGGSGATAERARTLDRAAVAMHALDSWLRHQLQAMAYVTDGVRTLVGAGVLDPTDTEALDAHARSLLASTPRLEGLALVTPDHRARRYERDGTVHAEDWSDRAVVAQTVDAVLARARAGDAAPEWGRPVWRGPPGHTAFHVRVPLTRDGTPVGVLFAMMRLDPIATALPTLLSDTGLTPYILFGRTHVLAHPLLDADASADAPEAVDLPREPPSLEAFADGHLAGLWAAAPLPSRGAVDPESGSKQDIRLADEGAVHTLRQIEGFAPEPLLVGIQVEHGGADAGGPPAWIVVGGLLVAVSAGGAVLLAREIARPLRRLAVRADAVAGGDLSGDGPTGPSFIREVRDSETAFDRMIHRLREQRPGRGS
jgi:HAMP domain-containing protein